MSKETLTNEITVQLDKLITEEVFPKEKRQLLLEAIFSTEPTHQKLFLPSRQSFYFQAIKGAFRRRLLDLGGNSLEFVLGLGNSTRNFLNTEADLTPRTLTGLYCYNT